MLLASSIQSQIHVCRHDVNGASSWYFLRHMMVRRCNNQKRREEKYIVRSCSVHLHV